MRPEVKEAWEHFQRRHGLVADGVPGEKTLKAVLDLEGRAVTRPSPLPPAGEFFLSDRSIGRMAGVHPDLQAVVHYAIRVTTVDFGITATGGVRTLELQRQLKEKGASKTMRSRHLTGHAIDTMAFINGKVVWDHEPYYEINDAFEKASEALAVPLRWGHDWDMDGIFGEPGEFDLPHRELPRRDYGDSMESLSPKAMEFLQSIGVTVA